MNLKELEAFCAEARQQGLDDNSLVKIYSPSEGCMCDVIKQINGSQVRKVQQYTESGSYRNKYLLLSTHSLKGLSAT